MTLLHPGELAGLRTAVEATFDTTAVVKRRTDTADTSGGTLTDWEDVATLPCTFSPFLISPRERERDARVQSISFWTFLFPAGSDVRQTDRLATAGRVFEVVGIGEASLSITHQVITQEIV